MNELDEKGADVIEIGIPFSEPVADGSVVAAATEMAIQMGGGLDYIFEGLDERKGKFSCGLVLMGYVNPFLQYAWQKVTHEHPQSTVQEITYLALDILAEKLATHDILGLIIPDLPLEESAPWLKALKKYDIDFIPLLGPNSSLDRMKAYAKSGHAGYVYVVSVMGTTGQRDQLPPEATETIRRARQAFNLPLALGFGLSNFKQLADIPVDSLQMLLLSAVL